VLDGVGLIPVVGEPADGVNALWYGAEGDELNAGLSAAGMVPFAGWGATGAKLGIKGAKAADEVVAAAPQGWRRGDDVWVPTRAGNEPAWSTVRGRYWKNESENPGSNTQWDDDNLARMHDGRAPQRFNPDKGGVESMELSHEPIPARDGGRQLTPRWPQDHAAVDPYRRPGY
jgi:hypothetical protein